MVVLQKKIVTNDEFAHLIPTRAGATFSQLWQVFYYTRMLKYVTYRHYIQIKRSFNKICTYKKLQELCELGYLKSPRHEVYCATNKVLPILKEAGYSVETLPAESIGTGDINELNNTDAFVQAVKLEHFHSLLYPQFKLENKRTPYLIPDALLILHDEKKRRYKLTFLEIEAKKPKWNQVIENKRVSYLQLAKDRSFYEYWKEISPKLGFPIPTINTLKFNVAFICNLKKDFGNGFTFIHSLSGN
jgi:hypothetical protein